MMESLFILEDNAIGFSTHRLLNDVKFPIDGCNDPVLEEISLIKRVIVMVSNFTL
jgi:CRISPR/Cas system CSM-associated protein Csm3 (group 7 of RAMP superfamily)